MKGKGNGKGGNRDQEEHGLGLDGIITDKRFVHLHSDPRFMRLPRNNSKVSIDSRFNRMFSDKNFSESSSLAFDKRGKPKKKSETHKLHQFYYHLHQDEEDEENEDGTNEQAEKSDETNTGKTNAGKTQKKIDEGNTNKQKEENAVGFLSNANSTQKSAKGRKNRNNDRAKQGEILIGFSDNVSADEHGQENTHGVEALDIVTTAGVDDPKKKKKKKKKDHEMDDRLVDLDQKLYAKEIQEDSMVGELKEIKKKKNKMRLDRDMCRDEAHEINQAVKLKKKKKRDSGNNNSLPTLAEKMYMSEGEADIRGVEHVKEKKDQVRAHLEVAARIASGSCKSNSTVGSTSKKKRDGSRPKRSGENVCVEEESDVIELSRRGDESADRKKCKSKQDSIFGAGRKGSTAVEEFQKKDHRNEEDQDTSESESFSDEYFDVSESEQNETSSSSDDDDNYEDQIEPELPEQEEVPTLDCETRRLAVVNMDWNHIKIIEGIKKLLNIVVDPSTIAQAAIPQIIEKTTEDFHRQTLQLLSHAADICYDRIQKINVLHCPAKPQGSMFVMVKINISGFVDVRDDIEFSAMLAKEESVVVLPGSPIGLKNWIRVTFAISPSVLEEGFDRIAAFCMRHAKDT